MSRQAQAAYAARRLAEDPEGWRAHRAAIRRAWQARNQDKHRAHNLVYAAIKAGKITRPETCENCMQNCKPEAAHTDYSRPLDVRWLCRLCHARFDYSRKA